MQNFWFHALRQFTRPAYRIQGIGIARFAEATRRWAARRGPEDPIEISDFSGSAKFYCYLREHMGSQIFFRGTYSGGQLRFLHDELSSDAVFVDGGANQGEFTISLADHLAQGRVLAFEPVSRHRSRLERNVAANGFTNVTVLPFALGEEWGEAPIFDSDSSFEDGTINEGLPSLFASSTRDQIAEVVQIRRLDDVLNDLDLTNDRIDAIKLDVEGAEFAALRGAKRTLQRLRPMLILELGRQTSESAGYDIEELVSWIEDLGYYVELINEKNGDTSAAQEFGDFQNVVCRPFK